MEKIVEMGVSKFALRMKLYWFDHIKEDKMHEKCSTLRRDEQLTRSFSWKRCKVDNNFEIILKWILKNEVMMAWAGLTWIGIVISKTLFSVKDGEFFDLLSDCLLFTKEYDWWS
jgi:hypothetical protein